MNKGRGWKWLEIIFLATVCTWMLAACGDDDDDGDAAGGGAGDTIIIEGDDADDTTQAPAENDTVEAALIAPQLVSPRNGQIFEVDEFGYASVRFEWTAVPGAADYVFDLDNYGRRIFAKTTASLACDSGPQRWRVRARDANGATGPASSFGVFRVNASP